MITANVRLKSNWNEEKIINRLNSAIKNCNYNKELKNMQVEVDEAKKLFNDLFEGADFNEYIDFFDESIEEGACDIIYMFGWLRDSISRNVRFNFKDRSFIKVDDIFVF